jgi:hypothetical protein
MGNKVSLPPAVAEQMMKVPTVVPSHDWYPHIIVLPVELCVKKMEIEIGPGNKKYWELDEKRSCKDYDVYKDAYWWWFWSSRSDLEPRSWRYATRVCCPKEMMPNANVLSRAGVITVHRPFAYLG